MSRATLLKAAQSGDIATLQRLHAAEPSLLLEARSTSKGYSALHYAAMGGSAETVEWLTARGLAPDMPSTVGDPVTPLQVALEYKRLPAAKRLQQLQDEGRKDGSTPVAAAAAPAALPALPRPAPRFPPWIIAGAAGGGLDVPELDGSGPEVDAEAARLVAASQPFVWRRAALCPPIAAAVQRLPKLGGQVLDTNVCRRADRKFVYFAPDRLERGVYAREAIEGQYAPMRLNEQLPLEQTLSRQRAMAERDAGGGAAPSSADAGPRARGGGAIIGGRLCDHGGWLVSGCVEAAEGATYVMHKMLESASPAEAKMITERGGRMPTHVRPGIARLNGLGGAQHALWMAGLDPIARPVAEGTAWARVGAMCASGGWGAFEQAGLMVSGRDALTPTHYDGHHNVFLQVSGAKRFLLLAAEHAPNLYGFPALHPLDPLSRVDLEVADAELAAQWPRTRERARGAAVTLEAGDVLVMPQGVWHAVHSLDPSNVSVNLLFGVAPNERPPDAGGAIPGVQPNVKPPPRVGRVPPPRRAAVLAELAKSLEGMVANVVGAARAPATLASLAHDGGASGGPEVAVVRQLVEQCLAPAAGGDATGLPSVQVFMRAYFDERRFSGLPMRVR